MITYLLQASICSVIFYSLYHFAYATNKNHSVNRFYLLASLLLSLLIPIISIPVFTETIVVQPTPRSIGAVKFIVLEAPFDWMNVVVAIFWFGVIINLGLILQRILQLTSIIKNGEKEVLQNKPIVYTKTDLSLSSFGRWIIAPLDTKGKLSEFEITHEMSHISRHHTFDIIAIELYKAFFWFNPVIRLYKQRMSEIHEYQADQDAANHCGHDIYQSFLLEQISSKHQPYLVNNFNSIFKKRLIMMNSKSKDSKWHYLYILPFLLITLIFFSFESYPHYVNADDDVPISMGNDTITPGTVMDTVVMYNPLLKKEVVRIIAKPKGGNAYMLPSTDPVALGMNWVDTLSIIDYDTYQETVVHINYMTGAIDTLQY